MKIKVVCLLFSMSCGVVFAAQDNATAIPSQTQVIDRFAQLALECVHKEYPNIIKHMMTSNEDVKNPKRLYPAFYGCFDWHSSVHGHWLLTRIASQYPDSAHYQEIMASLSQSFTEENMQGELAYFNREDTGTSFERPYGLAWFLQLTTELREWDNPQAKLWLKRLTPLENKIVANVSDWLPKLSFPIRVGEHSQTAFAFGLMLDWSNKTNNLAFHQLLINTTTRLYASDVNCPLAYEPSGQDFLSPCIAEADLMRRVLPKSEYAKWLAEFLPSIPKNGDGSWLTVATVVDKSDGKLAHLDGLNLSRAWMLEGIASALPDDDKRLEAIQSAARKHHQAGINSVIHDMHYMGSHWLGSFATYLTTQRGLHQE
ncbi:DUF2891 domain-containing protein [Paraglaciecola polaris]|uniref:DUF2891 domain-containing protein n=1 Tax=Paraglaciecola polaris LMG 21857 TaxID=1129793 RepID=K6ZVA8_9ALTE|nr:DUF2891 domain-containing protein [Paraglaciecola polaris]GAC32733.1 hypothetical protein GPLA_1826 [Paraglaciecola polaris LMG 21857]|tara:strand:+ start:2913 stop:4025 length:1113 start_codon:yes stop_codon:yes gene_type:complete